MQQPTFLGRGNFSLVHKTWRLQDNLPVVLKRVQVFEMKQTERNDYSNEIDLLKSMSHPHIIEYLDCMLEDNELYVVMEWAQGGDLAKLLKRAAEEEEPLAESRIWSYIQQIADALSYMHDRRVMHRDIKPANVFVISEQVIKLGDLGLGRYFSSKTDQATSTVGTPYYMSPECMQEKGYDFKSDIWSLGCLLYELATLRSPFFSLGINYYVLGKRMMSGQFEPMGDACSAALTQLVEAMLMVDSADRPSAAAVFRIASEQGR